MQVLKISTFNPINNKTYNNTEKNQKPRQQTGNCELPNYNDIAFLGIRVDKGLGRFFQKNKDLMPATLRKFISALSEAEKTLLSPLEAQRKAFKELEQAKTTADIKRLFTDPDEKLFQNLIDPEETKAKRGILSTYRENRQLIELCNKDILESKENLTVYLVKKIFLEGKTLEEINTDLEKDIDKEFLDLFKSKNPKYSKLIQESTLKALGIKSPDSSYQQSLRYTRDGYSDMVGESISKAQKLFWESLSPEQRTIRAKKSVEKFEAWWNSIPYEKKLEMIADQEKELRMLEEFNSAEKATSKKPLKPRQATDGTKDTTSTHTHVGSKKLSKDDLFKIWAKNNLKIFEEGLSPADKELLETLRALNLAKFWAKMTPAQKTEYIQKLKTGNEKMRFVMIDTWNNCKDIILALSKHLLDNQIYKPHNLLYSSEGFSEFQSRIMQEFWSNNPEFAEKLGKQMEVSYAKIKTAMDNQTFEQLKKDILKDRDRRINEIAALKKKAEAKPVTPETKTEPAPPKVLPKTYKDEFVDIFRKNATEYVRSLPPAYLDEYPKIIAEHLPEDILKLWTRNLRREILQPEEMQKLLAAVKNEPPALAKVNRALEAAMADTIARFTGSPEAYELSHSDIKTVMHHLEHGDSPISIISHKNNDKKYNFRIIENPKKIDKKQISKLYETYSKSLTKEELEGISTKYFLEAENASEEELKVIVPELMEYLDTYGRSIRILFSDKSNYSSNIKAAFNFKFLNGMPENLKKQTALQPAIKNINDVRFEKELSHYRYLFGNKYDFMPSSFLDIYFDAIAMLARANGGSMPEQLGPAFIKRKSAEDWNRVILVRKMLPDKYTDEILAMEQALADIMYDATGEVKVYNLSFENLMDKFELLRLSKKFPSPGTPCPTLTNDETLYISAKKRPQLYSLKQKYNDYLKQIREYRAEIKDQKPENYNEILYILNPKEDAQDIDLYTAFRMASRKLNTKFGNTSFNVD